MGAVGGISVVIPAFQAAGTVAQAIRSALQQVPPPGEVIVVDDGSTDGTAAVLQSFGTAITVITQENRGEAAARNAGLAAARHDRVAYLDADDWFLPGRLAAVAALLERDPGLDVVTTDAFLVAQGEIVGRAYGPQWEFADRDQRAVILQRNFVFGHVVVRAAALRAVGGFEESISRTTDWAAWIKVILAGGRVGLVPRPLSTYRLHSASLSADRLGMALGSLQSLAVAARQPSLTAEERLVLHASTRAHEAAVRAERLAAALDAGGAGSRRLAWAVARDGHQSHAARAKAFAVLVSPGLARRARARHNGGTVVATAGRPIAGTNIPATEPSELVTVVIEGVDGAELTADSLRAQSLPVANVVAAELGVPAVGELRGAMVAVVPAGAVLDDGALERRLEAFAWHCEAAAVVDRTAPGRTEIAPRVIAPGDDATAAIEAGLERVVFRVAALRSVGVRAVSRATGRDVLTALARRHPIVVLDAPA